MTWTLIDKQLNEKDLLVNESLFFLGNGYLGVRANMEEGVAEGMKSVRGAYINAFHDVVDIPYGEKLYGFPDTQQKLLNVIDAQTVELYLGEEEERFSMFHGEVLSYERKLHLDKGFMERIVHWRSPLGREIKVSFRRLVSFVEREGFLIDLHIEPVNFNGEIKVVSTVNGDVANYTDSGDPRIASGHAKRMNVTTSKVEGNTGMVADRTFRSELDVSCVTTHRFHVSPGAQEWSSDEKGVVFTASFRLDQSVSFTKFNCYTDTLRHGQNLIEKGLELLKKISARSFDDLLMEQKYYLDDYWQHADVEIEGDEELQEGIRFNLYHLLQSVGRDEHSNIAAKGLSGEGYEGHYFWDTEIYMFPVFLLTKPDIAKQLLIYRYSILDHARARAREMGHKQGALFPWRTIAGPECSSYYPAGTAQYHISADIAYSYIQYYLATEDRQFLEQYGAEVLFETARLWIDAGHDHEGRFKLDAVTGPDEYTAIVNNNYYTNVMAKHNLLWAKRAHDLLQEAAPSVLEELKHRLNVSEEEISDWYRAAINMYLPYDETLKINPQDDSFLQKGVWDFENTPDDHYPLLLHYHPLTLYRYQVCKQADTVLAHFLLEDEQDQETIKHSYDYYERVTTHDSSLSSCIFSIMAAKVGYHQKAYDYFIETARLDLDNTHGNTKDGLHMANMGGTWLSIVYGFAGLRMKETGLFLAPFLPEEWRSYAFHIQYRGRLLKIVVREGSIQLEILEGEPMTVHVFGKPFVLENTKQVII